MKPVNTRESVYLWRVYYLRAALEKPVVCGMYSTQHESSDLYGTVETVRMAADQLRESGCFPLHATTLMQRLPIKPAPGESQELVNIARSDAFVTYLC